MARQAKSRIGDFEKSLKELETIVVRMEEGDQSLERSEEHTSELQSRTNLVCRLLLEKKKKESISYKIV